MLTPQVLKRTPFCAVKDDEVLTSSVDVTMVLTAVHPFHMRCWYTVIHVRHGLCMYWDATGGITH